MKKIIYTLDESEDIGVFAISTVQMPAMESNFIALKKEPIKLASNKSRKMIYGALMIPNKEILRVDKKTGEDFLIEFTPECIVKCSQMFAKNGFHNNATYEHQVTIEGLTLVESWIKEGESDKSVHLGLDEPIGTWFGGMYVDNDEVHEKIMSGEVKGFSIEGVFTELSKQFNEDQFIKELEQILTQ